MKDFSQGQMKADPPNTAVDTRREESLTEKKKERRWGLPPEPPIQPNPRNTVLDLTFQAY